ncbi:MAG: phage portal protein, partial [Acidobacteria bacterium]|nr:phage portal protein [Acidobacteriota bacterium]
MNILKFFTRVFERGGEVLPVTRSAMWDAAGGGNRLANWSATPAAANSFSDNPAIVRGRAEGEYRNNAWARKCVDAIVNACIGATGINPMFKPPTVSEAWARWADSCDAAGRLDWIGLQHQILQSVIVSGEVFVVFSINPDAAVPLVLTALGPEFLDTSKVDASTHAGIQYAGLRRTGYWLFERHPTLTAAAFRSVLVPAENCLHIFRPLSPGAERGVSWLAPVLLALREVQEFTEAALVRQKVASLYCGYVQTADGSNPLNATDAVPSLEPGSMVRLQAGEIVEFSEPPEVGQTYDPFVRSMLRKIASGMNLPYEIVSGDQSAITFASGRHGLLEWKRHAESVQHVLMVPQFCAPVLKR